jgi:hypothetical protein
MFLKLFHKIQKEGTLKPILLSQYYPNTKIPNPGKDASRERERERERKLVIGQYQLMNTDVKTLNKITC